ncbi:uncharacterized protein LOC110847969 [Folsomia candida]|uniref:uncharacterized protein LOC110847969 n=1 Tax=Folsomia candida TaxID=158441 RepID=UPI000B8F527D|nr:uncharacterized protein LOC110847969 [Folsomia candida]
MDTKIGLFLLFIIIKEGTPQSSPPTKFTCPHEYGFYPHPRSCDKYYKCENSIATLKTCGNGLGFEDSDPKFLAENCDYLHNVDCGDRSELEPPQSSANCPRLYGIFHDETRCDTFWSCWNGEASRYTCAPGLAYDADARVCMWADQVPGCKVSQSEGGFQCPNPKDNPNPGTFSRHAHPEDCRKYYVCLDGNPREYGCPIGTVFKIGGDDYSGQCEDPTGVDGCENYYGDELKGKTKGQLLLGGDDGSYKTATNKPTLRKKIHVQKQQQNNQQVDQEQEQQTFKPKQQQQQLRPKQQSPQQQQRPQQQQQKLQRPTTTPAPTTTTTTTPKPAVTTAAGAKEDEYYYYDENYDVPATNTKQ